MGEPICPSKAYQGAKTLHMIWMWGAVYGVLEGPSTDKAKKETNQRHILAR
jgi:hypothetical protein